MAPAQGFIYFIKPIGLDGPVKIGWSTKPESRLLCLMIFSPLPLEIVAKVPGTTELERNLHACFAESHSHCEWFQATPKLTAAVDALRQGLPIEKAVDLAGQIGPIRADFAPPSPERHLFLRLRRKLGLSLAKANRAVGDGPQLRAPDDVANILSEWSGRLRREPWTPGRSELLRVEETIADPLKHGIPIIPAPSAPSEAA